MLSALKSYRYLHLDVFTAAPFGGNQLAVFLDGRGLNAGTQQAIAKEMNFSETTFVLPAEAPQTDMRVRIFTPGLELPMAGHPTIGTAFALARAGIISPRDARVVFGLGVGPTEVALTWEHADLSFAWMSQAAPVFGEALSDRAGIAAALGLPESALAASLPVAVGSTGVPYLLVPLRYWAAIYPASLNAAAYEQFKRPYSIAGDVCVYLFTTEPASDGATAYARMFGPAIGIGEDPATGSACGPLGGYLVRHGIVSTNVAASMRCLQGVKMGRPSSIHIAVDLEAGQISRVRVGGQAVVAGEGILYVDTP
jgi:trans-2,3-dihydro-3-hydroxyanthranilate isomerase